VDDYHDAVEMWAIFLRAYGYDVLTSEDGVQALQMAQTTMPDIVVLDLELPGMNGAEVARRLRASPDTAHIPLIAASGHSGHAELEEARAAGFDRILLKPCDPPVLIREIEALLNPAST
jgi:CheY-like chemotaxis protein